MPPRRNSNYLGYRTVIVEVASLLAAPTHPGHVVDYAPGDLHACRLDATLGYRTVIAEVASLLAAPVHPSHVLSVRFRGCA
ncbi:MAG TPA: hypothetical protein DHV72_00900 [Serratia grimesii]|uniref:Uncharacterized protein n=1 Tax=Serratia grimesii TaxID=82995 RepID=A0A9C7V5Q1_9GAMM|nr:hypothetical protein [Serratia grimesii]